MRSFEISWISSKQRKQFFNFAILILLLFLVPCLVHIILYLSVFYSIAKKITIFNQRTSFFAKNKDSTTKTHKIIHNDRRIIFEKDKNSNAEVIYPLFMKQASLNKRRIYYLSINLRKCTEFFKGCELISIFHLDLFNY